MRSTWWRWLRVARPGAAQASELDVPRALGSYEELLADPDVDAVYISLPNSMHVDWSVRALEAGKHVLCEKPLARAVEPVERAFDAADAAGRAGRGVHVAPPPAGAAAGRAAAARRRPARGEGEFSFALGSLDPASNIRLSAELEGGALMDVGCYCVSAARLVAGEPVAVTAQQVVGEVDVRFAATLSMP